MASLKQFLKSKSCPLPVYPRANFYDVLSVSPVSRIKGNSFSSKSFSTKSARRKGLPVINTIFEEPRSFPTTGYDTIETENLIEEEELPDYRAYRFYPVRLGEIFQDRYQTVAKLGFGACSTIWLARDLRERRYVALKVSLFHDAAQMSLRDMKVVFRPNGFEENLVKGAIVELLTALDFLHTHAEVVHTDVHFGNMLIGTDDNDYFRRLEEVELTSPVPRKSVSPTRTIYLSRSMRPKDGPMLLSDFSEARVGPGPHDGYIMPPEYRAPEVLLHVQWSYPVDIWSVGLTAWELLEPRRLFNLEDENDDCHDAAHLAQLIAALGPPPPKFLAKNPERRADFWDEHGRWLDLARIPESRTIDEALQSPLEDRQGFLRFLRKALTWLPEERATAKELLQGPWLAGGKT